MCGPMESRAIGHMGSGITLCSTDGVTHSPLGFYPPRGCLRTPNERIASRRHEHQSHRGLPNHARPRREAPPGGPKKAKTRHQIPDQLHNKRPGRVGNYWIDAHLQVPKPNTHCRIIVQKGRGSAAMTIDGRYPPGQQVRRRTAPDCPRAVVGGVVPAVCEGFAQGSRLERGVSVVSGGFEPPSCSLTGSCSSD